VHAIGHAPKNVTIGADGNLLVSLPGRLVKKRSTSSPIWINSKTGSRSYCVDNPDATVLSSIDLETLDLRSQRMVEDEQFISIRQRDGRLYAAARYSTNCSLDTNVRLVELMDNLESKTLFQTTSKLDRRG
jgi:hypothetical protein